MRDRLLQHENRGDLALTHGDLTLARQEFEAALSLAEQLLSRDVQRDLAVSLKRPGDVEVQAGNLAAARALFDRSLKVREALAAAGPTSHRRGTRTGALHRSMDSSVMLVAIRDAGVLIVNSRMVSALS